MKDQYKKRMRLDPPATSPLTAHLNYLRTTEEGVEVAEGLTADLIETFTTESGLRTLMLFEKSILHAGVSNGAPDSALRELNACRNLILDLRRIVAHG